MVIWHELPPEIRPEAHKVRHQDAGADEISVTGLSGLLADDQHVLDAEVTAVAVAHALATAINDFLVASGSGVFVKKTLAETLTILGKAVASGLASLDASSLVVQNPANATATPTASKIPIADGSGKLDGWVTATATIAQVHYAKMLSWVGV